LEEESGELDSSSAEKPLTFSEYADEMCAYYMSIGVAYDEYWHGNYAMLAFRHKAFEMERERAKYDAWIQGAYVYDALCMVSPVLHAFAKPRTKPIPYHKEPYGAKSSDSGVAADGEKPKKTDKEIQDIQALNASAKFASFMTQWNKRFDSEGGGMNGGND
jgi:hypothetical protein